MAIHVHPLLRSIEEAREQDGLYKVQDSVAVAALKVDEAAGKVAKVVPLVTIFVRSTVFVPSPDPTKDTPVHK